MNQLVSSAYCAQNICYGWSSIGSCFFCGHSSNSYLVNGLVEYRCKVHFIPSPPEIIAHSAICMACVLCKNKFANCWLYTYLLQIGHELTNWCIINGILAAIDGLLRLSVLHSLIPFATRPQFNTHNVLQHSTIIE